jgi:hypothetical protein
MWKNMSAAQEKSLLSTFPNQINPSLNERRTMIASMFPNPTSSMKH